MLRNEKERVQKDLLQGEYSKIREEIKEDVNKEVLKRETILAESIINDKNKKVWEIINRRT
jgi:hypothetical protein